MVRLQEFNWWKILLGLAVPIQLFGCGEGFQIATQIQHSSPSEQSFAGGRGGSPSQGGSKNQLDPNKLLLPSDLTGGGITQYQATTNFDGTDIHLLGAQTSGKRISYPRLIHDQTSKRNFLIVHTGANWPYKDNVNSQGCSEGMRTVRLLESSSEGLHNFRLATNVDVACGHRVENADGYIHNRRLYVPYVVVGDKDTCQFDGDPNQSLPAKPGQGGKRWQIRIKRSSDIDKGSIQFSGFGGKDYGIVNEICVHNSVNGGDDGKGTAEPFVFKISGNDIYLVYADEATAHEKSCGQVIRLAKFNMTTNKTVLDKEIGHCPGQGRRDGMAVVLRHPKTQKYHMTFESLGGGEDQIILMDSTDGVNWSNRRAMIGENALGAQAVGLPYLKNYDGQILLAATEVYSNHTKYRIRFLDDQGQKIQKIITLDERKYNPGNLPAGALYWGNIEVIGDRVYGTGAALAGTPLTLFSRPLAKQSSTPPPSQVQLSWDKIETAEYSLDLRLKSGQMIGNCVNAYHMKMKTSHLFKGDCPDNPIKEVDLSQVTHIYIHSALNGEWKNPEKRRKAVSPYTGQSHIHLQFR